MTYFVEEARSAIRNAFAGSNKTPARADIIVDCLTHQDIAGQKRLLDVLGVPEYGPTSSVRRAQIDKGLRALFGTGVSGEKLEAILSFSYKLTPANAQRLVNR